MKPRIFGLMVDDFNNFFQSEKVTNTYLKHICRSNDERQRQVKVDSERCIAKVGDERAMCLSYWSKSEKRLYHSIHH